jgi:long-chain acyl-CoA synthetase
MGEKSISQAFAATVAARADEVALRAGRGADTPTLTWAQYAERAARVGAGLAALGLRPGERVALMLRNRPEFHVADMGILLAGGTPVSIYNSSPPDRIAYVADHAEARLAIVDEAFAERFHVARPLLSKLEKVVVVGGHEAAAGARDVAFDDLLGSAPVDLEAAAAAAMPDDLLTIIYTSGTTGDPKGVMLTHANLTFAVDTYRTVLGRSLEGLRQVSFLPMAHIAERLATHYFHVCEGSDVTTCGDVADLVPTMAAVQPEWFFSAPRLWEKFQGALEAMVANDPVRAKDFAAARELGWQVFLAERDGGGADTGLAAVWAEARSRHVTPLLEKVGLGHVLIALTGAAPIPRSTSEFFLSLGVPLSEVWGMSETSGLGTWSPHHIVPGTTGRPVPGIEIRLGAEDEIFVRGPCVFSGYLNDPEVTAQTLDTDGWLHTGDIGRFDADGNLSIIDRLKDIIVPSSGHNVSPARLEARLKECPLIGQACVVGDGRPHVAALIVPDPDRFTVCDDPAFRAEIHAFIAALNETVPPAERIVAFEVLPEEWPPDSDVLTPTAKLKRRAVNRRYASVIDDLYAQL